MAITNYCVMDHLCANVPRYDLTKCGISAFPDRNRPQDRLKCNLMLISLSYDVTLVTDGHTKYQQRWDFIDGIRFALETPRPGVSNDTEDLKAI